MGWFENGSVQKGFRKYSDFRKHEKSVGTSAHLNQSQIGACHYIRWFMKVAAQAQTEKVMYNF